MKKIETEYTCQDQASAWAEEQGYTVIMTSSSNGGKVTVTVI